MSNDAQSLLTAEDDPRWQAVLQRRESSDGRFVYAVKSTGVYCRPSCPSRGAKPENVVFFADGAAAAEAGFRPCKRCDPLGPSRAARAAALVARACRLIEDAEEPPALAALAAALGVSPHYFHRQFKSITGLTPRAYGAALRANRLRAGLAGASASVTQAIYDAGFNSSGRFYAASDGMLGMKASSYRKGGHDQAIRFAVGQCSLGAILVAQSARGICAILLGDDPDRLLADLRDRFPNAEIAEGDAEFGTVVAGVIGFVEAPKSGFDLPLDIQGTAFQHRVWQALGDIPAGETASYAEIARRIGRPTAFRAVAQACGANKIAIAIPCHRAVRNDGGLSGYRWGVERKRELLKREAGK